MSRLPSLGPRGEGWVALQGILLVVLVAAGLQVGPDWAGPLRVITSALGIVALGAGLVLGWRGIRDLGSALTPNPHPKADATLVETGVYAHARHPIYGGIIVAAAGWALVTASLTAGAVVVVLVAFFTLKSMREEAWLERAFAGYDAYRRRTRRFIPWIGRWRG